MDEQPYLVKIEIAKQWNYFIKMLSTQMSLIEAVENNDVDKVMQLLTTNEADVYETDAAKWTPLIRASRFGLKDIVELLLNYDNSSEHVYLRCENGGTALM